MRVVMTGGGGFIGSHLLARMLGAGMDVTLIGSTIGKSRYTASLVSGGAVRFLRCDDSFAEEDILRPALPDAQALVLLGYVRPSSLSPAKRLNEELIRNLAPLVRLLRAAEGQARQVIFASSVGVYGSRSSAPVRETDAPRPETPYAIAKLASESSIDIVCAASGWTPSVLRYATVYGPGETVPRAIPNFIRAALDGQPPVIAGDGLDEHDYVHVGDVVDATMLALRHRASGVFNIGSGVGTSTLEVARTVVRLAGANVEPVFCRRSPASAPVRVICATDRARNVLKFAASRTLADGITEEIGWFRSAFKMSPKGVLAASA
jgi:nucleoside-diphosphate-sugar epimerase